MHARNIFKVRAGKGYAVLESVELEIASVKKLLTDRLNKTGGQGEQPWIENVNRRLDCHTSNLEPVREMRKMALDARAEIQKFYNLLLEYGEPTKESLTLMGLI